jgi:hypothetical protein
MRRLLVAVIALIVLVIAVDRVAKVVVERQVASRIEDTYNLSERPQLTVHGFPFLTQVLRRELNRVDVQADGVTIEDAQGLDIDLTLRDVGLLEGYRGRAGELDGTVEVPYGDLVRLARRSGATAFGLSYGGDPGTIAVRSTIAGPGGDVDVVAFGAIRLAGSRLTMRPSRVEIDGQPADPVITELARDQLALDVKVPRIPGAVTLESLHAAKGGLRIGIAGRNVSVG